MNNTACARKIHIRIDNLTESEQEELLLMLHKFVVKTLPEHKVLTLEVDK